MAKKAQTLLPGLEIQPDEPVAWRQLRFVGSHEIDEETYSKLAEYADLRGITLQVACQEALRRFFAERASGVDAMLRHDASIDGFAQRADYSPESGWD